MADPDPWFHITSHAIDAEVSINGLPLKKGDKVTVEIDRDITVHAIMVVSEQIKMWADSGLITEGVIIDLASSLKQANKKAEQVSGLENVIKKQSRRIAELEEQLQHTT